MPTYSRENLRNLDKSVKKIIEALAFHRKLLRSIWVCPVGRLKRDREQLNKMISELKAGDTIVVADMTRISRSSKDLLDIVDKIKEKGAFIKSIKDTWLDTTSDNPYQSFLMTVMSGLSQLERDLISSRVKEGLEAARKRGHYPGRPRTAATKVDVVRKMNDAGMRICDIVTATGLSRSTVNRILGKQK